MEKYQCLTFYSWKNITSSSSIDTQICNWNHKDFFQQPEETYFQIFKLIKTASLGVDCFKLSTIEVKVKTREK